MIGLRFDIRPADVDETPHPGQTVDQVVQHLARVKAAAGRRSEEEIVIGSDTLVSIDGQILGKPVDKSDARRMLTVISGRTHQVHTGLAILYGAEERVGFSVTDVEFRNLTAEEIGAYIETGEPMDKAGAYAVQGKGAVFIPRIHGDFFNVVGLPVFLLHQFLRELGLPPADRGGLTI